MKGKRKDKKKIGKIILLAMSFVMTIVLTFTMTMAWFYDSDWASNSVTMAGSVGIELRAQDNGTGPYYKTSGAGQLHFVIDGDLAYPGQSVEVSASVFNNGGTSMETHFGGSTSGKTDTQIEEAGTQKVGSACYVRAHFAVYTDIGVDTGFSGSTADDPDQAMNARYLYDFLQALIDSQNLQQSTNKYKWTYYQNSNTNMPLDGKYWYNGTMAGNAPIDGTATPQAKKDIGFFYLCYDDTTKGADNKILKPLEVGKTTAFLWNSTFVIPWQLTNTSADKHIFVGVTFQAIQTFIPIIENGSISKLADNQLSADLCTYDSIAVQTVFNSSHFKPIELVVNGLDFSQPQYRPATTPSGYTAS